jgi:hypothetical protein
MSAFGGKADMTVCGNPLSRSLLGAKRTCPFALHMSANDPKWTSVGRAERLGSGDLAPGCALANWLNSISTRRERIVDGDRTLEVAGLSAGDQANLLQRRKLLLGFGGLPEYQIELTQVLVSAPVAAIEK